MAETKIEPVVTNDIRWMIAIAEEANLSPWSFRDYYEENARYDAFLRKAVSSDGEFLGFIVARYVPSNTNVTATDAEIYNIGVESKYRRRGTGSELLNALIRDAVLRRIEKIWLDVRRGNETAISFYQRHSFVQAGIRKNFYSNARDDGVVMMLDLVG
ncbi:MAG: GNAT family N-acetyltransferase [Blastocatellia bacterium]|nr:GNAT family N-acetyltransferase [Blastocatellia bacterium]